MTRTQTLVRGLELVDAVANGATTLNALAISIRLPRSTVHRLATTLVEWRYLEYSVHDGYGLGPKLLGLSHVASCGKSLPRIARAQLESLARSTRDTVHLGVIDGTRAMYLDRIPGTRRVAIASRIGERLPLHSTGLGKALILDADERQWREYYQLEVRLGSRYEVPLEQWLERMREHATRGYAVNLEESDDHIRCVAAPIRGADGVIVGAISVLSAAQYMSDARVRALACDVCEAAVAISSALGFESEQHD